MSNLFIEIPDSEYAEIEALAREQGVDVAKFSQSVMLGFVRESRAGADFQAARQRGDVAAAMAILKRLDARAA